MSKTIHNEKYKRLVAELRKIRRSVKLTQQDVADALGKPQSYVAKTEGLERRLDVIELMELCDALGADKEWILRICLSD